MRGARKLDEQNLLVKLSSAPLVLAERKRLLLTTNLGVADEKKKCKFIIIVVSALSVLAFYLFVCLFID